ncbi:MAG TPA: acetyl-CoA carboxylase carboxyltransferase subunit alpha [Verrucomicrobiae bacterium]|jgi:acetyl-CoA carboxylase carboxyl transferase subunit alpha|nr:acetyl-CoA carboxylase carboxyltransferase subunit alpha [Verrucomicrobiae bacterium]
MKNLLDFEKPIFEIQSQLDELRKNADSLGLSSGEEIEKLEEKLAETRRQIFSNLTAWQRVQLARHPKRPYTLDYVAAAFTDFSELHGDRLYAEDRAMVGGFAKLGDERVMVIGTQKGRDTKENIMRNFGSAHPEGYRKALRLMRIADKFGLPIITIIDTAGAYPGIGAEERHIAEAIAVNLREMMMLEVPTIAVVIGEGGSGGALGIGVTDRVLILENAYYSVISPEGCAAILWKDRSAAAKAAEALKITARNLLELNLVNEVLPEPLGGAHNDPATMAQTLKTHLLKHLEALKAIPSDERMKQRYERFRSHGQVIEKQPAPSLSP